LCVVVTLLVDVPPLQSPYKGNLYNTLYPPYMGYMHQRAGALTHERVWSKIPEARDPHGGLLVGITEEERSEEEAQGRCA
jgi:hypothetical protein